MLNHTGSSLFLSQKYLIYHSYNSICTQSFNQFNGVYLKVLNKHFRHFGQLHKIILVFIPQVIFLTFLFFWMVVMMFMKWIMYSSRAGKINITLRYKIIWRSRCLWICFTKLEGRWQEHHFLCTCTWIFYLLRNQRDVFLLIHSSFKKTVSSYVQNKQTIRKYFIRLLFQILLCPKTC